MTQSRGTNLEMFEAPSNEPVHTIRLRTLERPLWTHNKAKLIERYLYYFVLVTKHGTYIDGFGGPQSPENADMWAAKLVLESRPRWLHKFVLGDKSKTQVRRLTELKQRSPRENGRSRRGTLSSCTATSMRRWMRRSPT